MNELVSYYVDNNRYVSYLDKMGVDVVSLKKIIMQRFDREKIKFFINDNYHLLSSNIYLESLVFECVFKYLYDHFPMKPIFRDDIKLDVRTMIATSKSVIQRPDIPRPSELETGFKQPDYEGDFRVISRFEKELVKTDNGNKVRVIFSGLLLYKVEVSPLCEFCSSIDIWENRYYPENRIPFIQGFNPSVNSIESSYVLWLNSELLNALDLRLDNYSHGLRALNQDNEVVLRFRCWRDQLIGNGVSFVGFDSNIAIIEGCDLILRNDYFQRLNVIIPDMVFYTKCNRFS